MALCALAVVSSANARSLGESNLSNAIYWLDCVHDGRLDAASLFRGRACPRHDQHGRAALRPARRFDRFDDPAEIARFAAAASMFRARRDRAAAGRRPMPRRSRATVRESAGIDRCAVPRGRRPASRSMQRAGAFLRACAAGARRQRGTFGERRRAVRRGRRAAAVRGGAGGFGAVAAQRRPISGKLKVCPNCNWLFLDRSRNSSRLWCDMAVCGNRAKARHHYRRQRLQREKTDG